MTALHQWPKDHGDNAELRTWPGEAAALVGWAAWTVDSLYYLSDLDRAVRLPSRPGDHQWHVVDLAHARWAASSAVGAIDLCAAALARHVGIGPTVTKAGRTLEFDFGNAQEAVKDGRFEGEAARWVSDVTVRPDVDLLTAIRHPTTHSRLRRHFNRGGGRGSDRTHLIVDGAGGRIIEVADIVEAARIAATAIVEDFLDRIDKGLF